MFGYYRRFFGLCHAANAAAVHTVDSSAAATALADENVKHELRRLTTGIKAIRC
ncbi:MAG: hypothetical protein MZV63_29220 [Marinilabiliales bacterium]|nr:hypothetical protein [Marinilabiliales bacterium]